MKMHKDNSDQLDHLVEAVLASSKYRDISADLVRTVATQELAKRPNTKEAIKAIKNKLHQVGGAYLTGKEDYAAWLHELSRAVQSGNRETLLATCQQIMSHHASTKERLPILDQFYSTIFAHLPPIASVLDVACGLNPLALPWMPLAPGATYYAHDIYSGMTTFLNEFFALVGEQGQIEGHAHVTDIITSCPTEGVDVAFILKTIPCLEQVDKAAGFRLLRALNARYLVVSFPLHSLGGRSKGMLTHYENHFRELVAGEAWEISALRVCDGAGFLVRK